MSEDQPSILACKLLMAYALVTDKSMSKKECLSLIERILECTEQEREEAHEELYRKGLIANLQDFN